MFFLCLFSSLTLPTSANINLSMLSKVWLLNFLQPCLILKYIYIYITIGTCCMISDRRLLLQRLGASVHALQKLHNAGLTFLAGGWAQHQKLNMRGWRRSWDTGLGFYWPDPPTPRVIAVSLKLDDWEVAPKLLIRLAAWLRRTQALPQKMLHFLKIAYWDRQPILLWIETNLIFHETVSFISVAF